MSKRIGKQQMKLIDKLVSHFVDNQDLFTRTLINLNGYVDSSKQLRALVHSRKSRIKDPEHLRDKLKRKASYSNETGKPFDITTENLFLKINDLAGFRILHLHTRQLKEIDSELKRIFNEEKWEIIEGPNARTWDDESRSYFNSIGIATSPNPNMYTSVHYIIKPNSRLTCELQVRTLMEEVWGEVDHSINYPHKTESLSCREQLKALARATSSCSRLVDSIFASHYDFESGKLSKSGLEKAPSKKKAAVKKKKAIKKPVVKKKKPTKKK